MECKICGQAAAKAFTAEILGKRAIAYFRCPACGFLQTEEPFWLDEAYRTPINLTDTGIMSRNLLYAKQTSVLLWVLGMAKGRFLDYAGGYGLFTRLMRDVGFDFYWQDPHTENLVARGFEYDPALGPVDLVTSFESFEHFTQPRQELEKMLKVSRNILFSTQLLPQPVPKPGEWWYYGLEHGQHVSFYTEESLRQLGRRVGLHYWGYGGNLHLFSEKPVAPLRIKLMLKLTRYGLYRMVESRMRSRTMPDMDRMAAVVKASHR